MQQTLVLIKPDAVQRGLIGEIISRFEHKGLKISAMRMLSCWRKLAEHLYEVHRHKPFFQKQVEFMISGPSIALLVEGKDAIAKARQLVGDFDTPGTIRGDFGLSIRNNLVHSSDSLKAAKYELGVMNDECPGWYRVNYELSRVKWLYTQEELEEKI